MDEALDTCDVQPFSGRDFVIHLDADGYVTSVEATSTDQESIENAECVAAALEGLQFPCLANFDVCPEYLIIE